MGGKQGQHPPKNETRGGGGKRRGWGDRETLTQKGYGIQSARACGTGIFLQGRSLQGALPGAALAALYAGQRRPRGGKQKRRRRRRCGAAVEAADSLGYSVSATLSEY